MTRRTKFYQWTATLPVEFTHGQDVWGGWIATRDLTYNEALKAAQDEMVAALGDDFAHLAQYVVLK